MAALNVDFTGDCTGLINAANRSKAEVRSFDGLRATAAVSLTGASGVTSDLGKVQSARESAGGTVTVGMDTSQISAGRAEIAGAREDARAFGRDMDSLGGSRAFSLSDGGSIQQANRDLSGMRGNLKGASEDFQATSRAGADAGTSLQESYSRVGSAAEGMGGQIEASTAKVQQHAMAMAGGGDSVTGANLSAASSFSAVESSMASAGRTAELTQGQIQSVTSALDSGSLSEGFNAWDAALGGTGGGPPKTPGGGGGGGGGGGSGGPGLFGEGSDNPLTKVGGMLDSGISKLGLPAIAGAAIGVVEAIAPAALGMMAMNEVVKDTPALAYASGKAMAQLGDGIREGSQGATAIGVPAFQALGAALRPLGEEVGHIGAANMGQMLGAETSLAGGLTTALKAIEPTIGPSIAAVENLGNAFLAGVASPEVAKGITATANALSTPQVSQAVQNITSWIATAAPYVATAATQVIGDVGGSGAGPANVGTGWMTQPVGETVAENSPGGIFRYDPSKDSGSPASGLIPGDSGGVSWNQNTQFGRGMTLAGSALTSGLGYIGASVVDMADGSLMSGAPTPTRDAFGKDFSGRLSDTLRSKPGGASSYPAGASDLAKAQAADPFGQDKAQDGTLTPSTGPGGGGGYYAGAPVGQRPQDIPRPGGTSPTTDTRAPAPGSSAGMLSPAQVSALSATLPSLSTNLSQTGAAAQQLSSGLQNTPQATRQVSQGLQQVQQGASQLAAPMQQASQHVQQTTQAVQGLAQQAPQAVSAVQQVAPAASKALSEAAPVMQSGGAQLGAVASTAVASGISDNQQKACDASAAMMNSAANCAKATAQISSPSKIFQDFGVNISTGLAIGIQDSTPQAVSAVQSAMAQVVQAGQQGLQTASPSKTFQTMGQQAMQQTAAGANSQNSATQQLNNSLAAQNRSYMPQGAMAQAQKDQEEQQRQLEEANDPLAKSDQAYTKFLDKMGYDKATRDRLLQKHHDEQKKDSDKGLTAAQKLQQSASQREDHNALDAMQKAGVPGLTEGFKDANGNVLTGHQQARVNTFDAAKARGAAALYGAQHGMTPAEAAQKLGAAGEPGGTASWSGAGRQNNDGVPSGQGGFGDPGKGFGKAGVGSNSSGYETANPGGSKAAGEKTGKDFGDGMKEGLDKGSDGAAGAAGDMSKHAVEKAKSTVGVRSPSTVFAAIGGFMAEGLSEGINSGGPAVSSSVGDVMSGALGAGVTVASNGVQSIASNAGLAVGYQWAQNVVTGADSVLKTADFQQISLPQLGSALAKTALGVDGLLGPAGSGGSIPNNLTVTMGAGTAAVPQVNATVIAQFGDQTIQAIAQQVVNVALGQLADSIPQQVG